MFERAKCLLCHALARTFQIVYSINSTWRNVNETSGYKHAVFQGAKLLKFFSLLKW
jgi:hypothetical protein